MVALAAKTGVWMAALAGIAVPSGGGQDALDRYRTQMANMGPQAPSPTAPADGAIAAAIAQWRALQQTDALAFDSYAGFLMAHPGWPGEAANRRAAEKQAANGSPASVVAYFRRFPPQSAAGGVAFARALSANGAASDAADAARKAWRRGALAPQDEGYVQTYYAPALTADDQDARMDALLWAGAIPAAQRQLAWTSPARRAAFAARLSLRGNAPDASGYATGGGSAFASDPGFVADRAVWLRGANDAPGARAWLAQPRALAAAPANPQAWYDVLLTNARAANTDGQSQLAYDIARQLDDGYPAGTDTSAKPFGERDNYTSLAWLGGQTALKRLGRPADAATLFDRYARASQAPQTRARGFYWAGRAAEAAGRSADAAGFYARAAGYRDVFYGQLALERTGHALVAPAPAAMGPIDPVARAAFTQRETVRAARFLGQIGDWQDQSAFIRQIAADVRTDTDHQLAVQLSREIERPDLAVLVGRSAMQSGLTDYAAAGFPTVPVPAGYEDSWTIIHAISRQESQFDRAAVSHAGARGLMQLMPGTAREQSGKIGLAYSPDMLTRDPNVSIMLGSSYFQRVFANYGSYPLAIAAYNAGGGNVNKWLAANGDPRTGAVDMVDWIEAIPFTETRNYVQRVLENAVVYDLMNPARSKSQGDARLSWYLGRSRAG